MTTSINEIPAYRANDPKPYSFEMVERKYDGRWMVYQYLQDPNLANPDPEVYVPYRWILVDIAKDKDDAVRSKTRIIDAFKAVAAASRKTT